MSVPTSTVPMSDEADQRLLAEATQVFDMFDEDGNGSIDVSELQSALTTITGAVVTAHEASEIIRLYDVDENGTLSLDEFKMMVKARVTARSWSGDLVRTFQFLCGPGNSHVITAKSLRSAAADVGEVLSEEEAQTLIDAALGGFGGLGGGVDYATFCKVQQGASQGAEASDL